MMRLKTCINISTNIEQTTEFEQFVLEKEEKKRV